MSIIDFKTKIVCLLEELINDRKKILLFDCADYEFIHLLCDRVRKCDYSDFEIWYSFDDVEEDAFLRNITQEQMNEIMKIYRLYDFSDKVIVISDSLQYGSLFNYVENEIITVEEMIDAVLYEIR